MPLAPIAAGGPGGMVSTEYVSQSTGQRHSLRFYVLDFNNSPTGAANDYTYTGRGPLFSTEGSVIGTVQALGQVWRDYYPPDWSLALTDVAQNENGVLTSLPVVPTMDPIVGVAPDTQPSGIVFKRIFRLRSNGDNGRMFVLSQIPGTEVLIGRPTTPTTGGIDARDQHMLGYLSGAGTAIVSRSGQRFAPHAEVLSWWARRLAPAPEPPGSAPDLPDQYIGPTPPTQPENGWLWIQTTTGAAPWQLWVYDAATAQWEQVGTTTPSLPPGHTGDLLVNEAGTWIRFPIGVIDQDLSVGTDDAGYPYPEWTDPCCTPALPIDLPGGGGGTGGVQGNAYWCGIAQQLVEEQTKVYNHIAEAVNALGAIAIGLSVVACWELLVLAFGFTATTAPAWLTNPIVWSFVTYIAEHLLNGFLQVVEPPTDIYLLEDAYCSMPLGTKTDRMAGAVIQTWGHRVQNDVRIVPPIERYILGGLVLIAPNSLWQGAANTGVQQSSTLCAGFNCTGEAMSGGALLDVPKPNSMTGGVLFEVEKQASMSGGASYEITTGRVMSGGASVG